VTSATARVSLAVVALIVGVLLIGQLRSQAPAVGLSSLSAQELTDLIETLTAGNAQLEDALAELEGRAAELTGSDGESDMVLFREEAISLSAFAGLLPMRGQGIVMEIEGRFEPHNVNDLIHELRNAGAEAIAIDDIRITASSVAVRGTAAIEIDGVPIADAFRVTAIGAPDGLESALERPGGVLSILELETGAVARIKRRANVEIPATERDLTPQVAEPVE
jgi:uncharacterized protein YlxW (UPF0749 family)